MERGATRGRGTGMGHSGKGPMNYQRPDQRILEDVCDCLTEDDDVDASQIEIKVDKCEVTLTGTVPSRDMKRRAEELAERVRGVKDVHNQIKVKQETRNDRRGETEDKQARGGNGQQGTPPNGTSGETKRNQEQQKH